MWKDVADVEIASDRRFVAAMSGHAARDRFAVTSLQAEGSRGGAPASPPMTDRKDNS